MKSVIKNIIMSLCNRLILACIFGLFSSCMEESSSHVFLLEYSAFVLSIVLFLQIVSIINGIKFKNERQKSADNRIIIQQSEIEKIIDELKNNTCIEISLNKNTNDKFIINLHKGNNHFNETKICSDDLNKKFISELNEIISNNIDNHNFSVENLADQLNISRIQLYRKVKSVLNENIGDYITNIRLEKAKTMLQDNKLTISEIAYKVGFSSPNYFSTVFKNKYGISPNTYKKRS